MQYLIESTAGQTIVLGPFVDDTDGKTAETGLSIANTDIRVHKHNGTVFAAKNSGGATHREAGMYTTVLDITDTNTLGRFTVMVSMSGALPVRHDFMVVPAATYDGLVSGSGNGVRADVRGLQGSAIATPTVAGVLEVDVTHVGGSGQSLPTAAALATVDANVDAILVDTGTTLDGKLNTIDSIVDAILVDTGTTLPATLTTIDNEIAVIDGIVDAILVDTGTTLDAKLNTIDGIVDSILADTAAMPTAAGIADAVWDEAQSAHTTAGTFGEVATEIAAILVDTGTTLDGKLTTIDNEIAVIDGVVDAILADTAVIGAGGAGLTALATQASVNALPTAAAVADAVWDEAQASHAGAGSFGEIATEIAAILVDTSTTLDSKLTTIDNEIAVLDANVDAILVDTGTSLPSQLSGIAFPTAASVADAVWDELQSAHVAAGSFGEIATEIAAVLVDTGTTIPASLTVIDNEIATLDANVDAVLVDTGSTIPAQISGLSIPTAAAVADAVWDETQASHVAVGTFGELATEIAAILVDTGTTLDSKLTVIDNEIAVIDSVVDAILVDTGTTVPAQISSLNNLSAAEVNTQATLALTSYDPPTKAELDSAVAGLATAAALATVDANVDAVLLDTGTTLPSTIAPLATASALAVVDANVDAILVDTSTTLDSKLTTIDNVVDSILVDTEATIPALISGIAVPSAAAVADAVWDEQLSGHVTSGSAGDATQRVEAITSIIPGLL